LRLPVNAFALVLFALGLLLAGGRVERPMYSAPIPERKRRSGLVQTKLFLHLPAIVVGVLIVIVLYIVPIHYPYHDIVMIALIAAYGLVMLVLYRFTNFANNLGSSLVAKDGLGKFRVSAACLCAVLLVLALVLAARPATLGAIMWNWAWRLFLAALFFPLFYIDEKERRMFADDTRMVRTLFLVNRIVFLAAPLASAILGIFNAAFDGVSMAFNMMIATCVEFLFRPVGASSFQCAVAKSVVFVILSFSSLALFY
jgi:hypothetical protein